MNMVRLAHIYDYLQATALRARLFEHGIEAHISEQLNTSSTAGEPALRLGGASALSPGHPIYVNADQLEEAKKVLADFAQEHGSHSYKAKEELEAIDQDRLCRDYRRKFLLISVVGSIMAPPFVLPIAVYYLWRYINEGGKLVTPAILVGLIFLIVFLSLWLYGVLHNPLTRWLAENPGTSI